MPARDIFHDVMKKALEKQGLIITNDPLLVQFRDIDLYVDLGAEKMIAAEKNGEKIAVEIKSFTGKSYIYELHQAVGQFIHYRMALQEEDSKRTLYLAISSEVYKDFFIDPLHKHLSKRTNSN